MRRVVLFSFLLMISCILEFASSYAAAPYSDVGLRQLDEFVRCLHSFRADFLQVNPDGSTQHGKALMLKPGLLKFDYDAPASASMVIKNGMVTYYDKLLKHYSYSKIQHPLIKLADTTIQDSKELEVMRVIEQKDKKVVHLRENTTNTSITLSFSTTGGCDSFAVTELSIETGAQGHDTTVSIEFYNIESNVPLSEREFHVTLH